MRGLRGQESHPGPVDAMHRLKVLNLVKHAKKLVDNPVVLEEDVNDERPISGALFSKVTDFNLEQVRQNSKSV